MRAHRGQPFGDYLMQRQSLSARRFYNAFYRWSTLACQPQHAPSRLRLGLSTSQRPFSHSTTVRSKKRRSSSSKGSQTDREQACDKDLVQYHSARGVPQPPSSWLTSTPASSTERPFDTLNAWEEVVRYRSSAGITIQTAIPADVVASLQQLHGLGLQALSEDTRGDRSDGHENAEGARIEVGKQKETRFTAADGPTTVVSVLYSGTLLECARVRARLERSTRRPAAAAAARRAANEDAPAAHSPSPIRSRVGSQDRADASRSVASIQASSGPSLRWTMGDPDRNSLQTQNISTLR